MNDNTSTYKYEPSRQECINIFIASCIETTAQNLGISAADTFVRMNKVGLIDGYIIPCYDVLHSESRENVTLDILQTLKIWEEKKGDSL